MKTCRKCSKLKYKTEFHKASHNKDKLKNICKSCNIIESKFFYKNNKKKISQIYKRNKKLIPWKFIFKSIKKRCSDKKYENYHRYGGRGIKCLITVDEIKELWFRDRAFEMKRPSIDRKDNDGNYTFDNCEFIEQSLNSSKDKQKSICQYDLNGNFIKEWKSITEASRKTKQDRSSIHDCLNQNVKQNKGCIWRYKHVA